MDKRVFMLNNGKTIFDFNTYVITGPQDKLSDEIRNYLRKKGIRFKPIHWRYTADEGKYNS